MINNLPILHKYASIKPWIVVLSASSLFFIISIEMNIFNAINPYLIKEIHLNAMQISFLASCYFYGNVASVFSIGMLLDRFSVKKLLLGAMTLIILSIYFFTITSSLWIMSICRILLGIAGSFSLLSCLKLASRWFDKKKISFVTGTVITLAMIGSMIAQTPMTLIMDSYGWRTGQFLIVIASIIFLLLIALFVKDYPETNNITLPTNTIYPLNFWQSLNRVVRNFQNWIIGIYLILINLPVFLFGSTWGNLYLTQVQNLNRNISTYITSIIFVGLIIGSPLIGWLAGHIKKRKNILFICSIFSLFAILALIYIAPLGFKELLIIFFIFGLTSSAQVACYPLIIENNIPTLAVTATGFSCTFIILNGLAMSLFSQLLNMNWDEKIIAGLPFYAKTDYNLAFMLLVASAIISVIIAVLIKE